MARKKELEEAIKNQASRATAIGGKSHAMGLKYPANVSSTARKDAEDAYDTTMNIKEAELEDVNKHKWKGVMK